MLLQIICGANTNPHCRGVRLKTFFFFSVSEGIEKCHPAGSVGRSGNILMCVILQGNYNAFCH